jgi:glycosyltransferase involved in cell wall biosynthesis
MIKVSVLILCYNHAPFIQECLKSVVSQKTNFPFEVLIHDDASTDNSQELIKNFEKSYPHLLYPIYQEENQYSKGISPTFSFNLPRAKGKYIALCEGDDYWIDPYKLQKQVDFLEANPDYSACFHQTEVILEGKKNKILFNNFKHYRTFKFKDLIHKNFVATSSYIFRNNDFHRNLPVWFENLPARDWGLYLLNAQKGKLYYMPECMSVYRQHSGGVWSSLSREEMINKGIEVLNQLNAAFNYEYDKEFKLAIKNRKEGRNPQLPITPYELIKSYFRKLQVWKK